MRYRLVCLSASLVLAALLLSSCFRNPRLLEGMYITHDGRIEAASPIVVRSDWELRLGRSVRQAFGEDLRPRVRIANDPSPIGAHGWQWQSMVLTVDVGAQQLDAGDLQQLIANSVQPVLAAGGTVTVSQSVGGP